VRWGKADRERAGSRRIGYETGGMIRLALVGSNASGLARGFLLTPYTNFSRGFPT